MVAKCYLYLWPTLCVAWSSLRKGIYRGKLFTPCRLTVVTSWTFLGNLRSAMSFFQRLEGGDLETALLLHPELMETLCFHSSGRSRRKIPCGYSNFNEVISLHKLLSTESRIYYITSKLCFINSCYLIDFWIWLQVKQIGRWYINVVTHSVCFTLSWPFISLRTHTNF